VILDVIIVMDIGTARDLLGIPEDVVSSFYVEGDDPARLDEVTRALEAARVDPAIDARRIGEFPGPLRDAGSTSSTRSCCCPSAWPFAVSGVIGIVNTMLMSTTERFRRVRRPADQRLVAPRPPDAGHRRECRPGPCSRACSGAPWPARSVAVANQFPPAAGCT